MGRRQTGCIEQHGKGWRVKFWYKGTRCCEPLPQFNLTKTGNEAAHKFLKQIEGQIARGVFDYAATFPGSKRGAAESGTLCSFSDWCDVYLQTKGNKASATKAQYGNALSFWKVAFGCDTPVESIPHVKILAFIGGHAWASAKLCNNYLIPLRGVFALASKTLHFENPMDDIQNLDHQPPPITPLSQEETGRIMAYMLDHFPPPVVNYFGFAFSTGMRPEEIIALEWGDIDWEQATARVDKAKSYRGEIKAVKTYENRDVDLTSVALLYLRRQKEYTFMKQKEVFHNPVTGRPWYDERSQRDNYWTPALRALGIRSRRAYQTRHTYATTLLMEEVNPTYIARQLGHKNAKMLFDVYATWIGGTGRDKEQRDKADRAMNKVPIQSQTGDFHPLSEGESGRHDWTRTNSPAPTIPRKRGPS